MKKTIGGVIFSRSAAFLHDLCWIPAALLFAYWLRYNLGAIPDAPYYRAWHLVYIAVPSQALLFYLSGLYRGFWRFASLPDLIRIVKAVLIGTLILSLAAAIAFRLEDVPRSVLLLYPVLLILGLIVPRVIYRLLKDHTLQLSPDNGKRILLVGAGRTGELLLRELGRRPEYQPVALVDDDPQKLGREIRGVRVVGNLEAIGDTLDRFAIDEVLVAIPSIGRSSMQQVIASCSAKNIPCRMLPSIVELTDSTMANSQVNADNLRPVTVEDLLGREVVKLDISAIAAYLKGKRILITGGGGSIGSELCRQVARLEPARLIVLEQGEFNLYQIEKELTGSFPGLHFSPVLGDVKNQQRVHWLFGEFRPQVVFHAAAYKHVPMLEGNPAEGVFNNVFGTITVAEAACLFEVEKFVLVSTDKAVNPTNVMGATKRIGELYCQNLDSRTSTKFITTRFGNVLGSAGSVVPLFEEQIRRGGPVTVTHEEITRFFMTIPEAVSLILQAGSMGNGGEVFVLEMGEPVRIRDLAEQMIRFSGLEPGKDIKIIYTGLRPGEKLHEQVFHEQEDLRGTNHAKLLLAQSRQVDWEWLQQELAALREAAAGRDLQALMIHLQNVVPEYTPDIHPAVRDLPLRVDE